MHLSTGRSLYRACFAILALETLGAMVLVVFGLWLMSNGEKLAGIMFVASTGFAWLTSFFMVSCGCCIAEIHEHFAKIELADVHGHFARAKSNEPPIRRTTRNPRPAEELPAEWEQELAIQSPPVMTQIPNDWPDR